MAISNVFGSNMFDICIALGVPTLLFSAGGLVIDGYVESIATVGALLGMCVIFATGLRCSNPRWQLGRRVGLFHVCLYAIYILCIVIVPLSR